MAEVREVESSGRHLSADHDGKLNKHKSYLFLPKTKISIRPELLIQIAMNLKHPPLLNLLLRHLSITVPVHNIVQHIIQILNLRNRRHKYHDL
jgi:hypothetical protein